MKNIHVLPTDKPSNLLLCIKSYIEHKDTPAENLDNKGNFRLGFGIHANTEFYQPQNIYITSDEEINEKTSPCWCINTIKNTWSKDLVYYQGAMPQYHFVGFKKIILTTDQDLDGVQAIDDEFLEWFIKNPSCEEVEVVKEQYIDKTISDTEVFTDYKIILPEEEAKLGFFEPSRVNMEAVKTFNISKQETLEEVAFNFTAGKPVKEIYSRMDFVKGATFGAKWQQERSYSEEELLDQLNLLYSMKNSTVDTFTNKEDRITKKWFKQFKKNK